MRRFLVLSLLLVGAGCQGLRDHVHCRKSVVDCATTEPCPPEKKVAAPMPEKPKVEAPKVSAPAPRPETAMPIVAQDVFFMPVTSYVPYTRATPTGPLRMTMGPNVAAPPNVSAPREEEKPQISAPGPTPPSEDLKKLVDLCEKQCERIDQLERCIKARNIAPPTVICPPSAPYCPPQPLFRRPLFQRSEPFFQRCDPICEPLKQCDPVDPIQPKQTSRPMQNPTAPAVEVSAPERLIQGPRQVSPAPKQQNPTLIIE